MTALTNSAKVVVDLVEKIERESLALRADIKRLAEQRDALCDFALNVGGTDDRWLASADINTLRAVMRGLIDEARATLAKARGETP